MDGPQCGQPAADATAPPWNQTSAFVRPFQGESVVWNKIESALPFIAHPVGPEPTGLGSPKPAAESAHRHTLDQPYRLRPTIPGGKPRRRMLNLVRGRWSGRRDQGGAESQPTRADK